MDSCGMNFVKYLLFIFNLIFAISGIGIVVAGAIVLAEIGDFSYFVEYRILAPAIALIVVGAIVFVVAFLGCFGAIRESANMLISFAVCLLIICLMELAVGIAAAMYKSDFETVLKESFIKSLANYSNDPNGALAWDGIHKKLKCCGVDGFGDWQVQGLLLPVSCCTDEDFENAKIFPYCIKAGRGKYVYEEGCYEKLQMRVTENAKILIGVGIGIAFVEVLGIVLACWLASTIKQDEKEDVEEKGDEKCDEKDDEEEDVPE